MKSKNRLRKLVPLFLIMAVFLLNACGITAEVDKVITEKDQMVEAFATVNTAILQFVNLKSGTLRSEYTGTFRPGGIAVGHEMTFERVGNAIHYRIIESYVEGNPLIIEEIAEDGILPDWAYGYFPNKPLEMSGLFDSAESMTILKDGESTTYRIDYSKNQGELPENTSWEELYSTYTIDNNGYLILVINHRSYYEQKPGESDRNDMEEYYSVNLTEYTE